MSEEGGRRISVSLGTLHVEVEGNEDEWVEETFESVWEKRLEESAEMKDALRESDRTVQ